MDAWKPLTELAPYNYDSPYVHTHHCVLCARAGFDGPDLTPGLEGLHGAVPEQQFLQMSAIEAHNNPAPVYADGSSWT